MTLGSSERVPAVPPAAGGEFRDLLRRQKEASPPEQVSATYTIVTPSSLIRSRAESSAALTNDTGPSAEKVSASYTIAQPSPPLLHSPTGSSRETAATITASYSVPLPGAAATPTHHNNNNNLKKTENLESSSGGKSGGSPTVKSRFRWDEERSTSAEEPVSGGGGGGEFKVPPVPAQRFQSDYPVHRYVRDKRQIFDLEMSANPLTLAEKLRIEASKYADTTRSNNDLPLVRSDSESSDLVSKKYDSVPSSPAHHTTERRPSWRLRVDAGSKVGVIFFS